MRSVRQLGSRWFADWIRTGGRVHRDQLPPKYLRALRRKAEQQLRREAWRRSKWRYVHWLFWAVCLGAAAAAGVRWVMGWR
jgi:hypothetical protein